MKKLGVIVLALVGISATTVNNDRLYEISKNIEIFVNVYKELNKNYVDDLDPTQLMRVGIDAMVESLDPYTNYISESEVASYRINTEGKYQGIGAIVEKVGDYITIIEPYQNSPVVKAGLQPGDQITKLAGRSTKGKSLEEMTQVMRGVPGTELDLTIHRPSENKTFDVAIERSQVSVYNVPYAGIVDGDIGYVVLTTFTANAAKNIRKEIKKLQEDNPDLKGIIFDLRSNGGGLLREAIAVSNIWVPQGKNVVSVKSKVSERDVNYKTLATPMDLEIPLAIMINKSSASASEIVSGVIQDMDRGVVIGQRSYGKGLVQNTMNVGYNSRVKVTTSKYYIPSGRCIQSARYKDGEPEDIPDIERAKFKTKNGRTVLDGGGVTPDIKLDKAETPEIIEQLQKQHILFAFINTIIDKYPETEDVEEVSFTDFEGFKRFVRDSEFSFASKNQPLLDEIKENLKSEKQLTILSEVEMLEDKITSEGLGALDAHRDDIISLIEEKIATRHHYQRGKFFQRLKNDTEIDEVISVLKDPSRYNKILEK